MANGLLQALWRFRWFVAGCTVAAAVASLGASFLVPDEYEASTRVYLANPRGGGLFGDVPFLGSDRTRAAIEAERMTSAPVLQSALERMDTAMTLAELGDYVTATAVPELDAVELEARSATPEGAVDLVEAVLEAYQAAVVAEREQQTMEAIAQLDDYREMLERQIADLDAALANFSGTNAQEEVLQAERVQLRDELRQIQASAQRYAVDTRVSGAGARQFEEIGLPQSPARPRRTLYVVVAALFGLAGSATVAWWRAERDELVGDRHDAARVLGAPLLAEVDDRPLIDLGLQEGFGGSVPSSTGAEAYRLAALGLVGPRRRLPQDAGGGAAKVLVVTGTRGANGTTNVTLNLAAAAASAGASVSLVDANLRVRDLSAAVGRGKEPGLSDYRDSNDRVVADELISSKGSGFRGSLRIVPAGNQDRDPWAFFTSEVYERALAQVASRGDLVLIDAPPILDHAETVALAANADGVVVVIDQHETMAALHAVAQRVKQTGVPLLGYLHTSARSLSKVSLGDLWAGAWHRLRASGKQPARPRESVDGGLHQ